MEKRTNWFLEWIHDLHVKAVLPIVFLVGLLSTIIGCWDFITGYRAVVSFCMLIVLTGCSLTAWMICARERHLLRVNARNAPGRSDLEPGGTPGLNDMERALWQIDKLISGSKDLMRRAEGYSPTTGDPPKPQGPHLDDGVLAFSNWHWFCEEVGRWIDQSRDLIQEYVSPVVAAALTKPNIDNGDGWSPQLAILERVSALQNIREQLDAIRVGIDTTAKPEKPD